MSRETPYNADAHIDQYLDGLMTNAERAAFEARLEEDASLRAQVEQQRQIDASLKRMFAPATPAGNVDALLEKASADAAPTETLSPPGGWRRHVSGQVTFAQAAVVLLALVGFGWLVWSLTAPETPDLSGPPKQTILAAFEQAADENFKPEWVCKNDKEFAVVFWQQLGQAVLMDPPPAGAKWTGIRYCNCVSEKTVCVLAEVDGKDVAVFVDREPAELNERKLAAAGLHAFHRKIDDLYLTELSPLDEPRVTPRFKAFDIPDEWKNYQLPYIR